MSIDLIICGWPEGIAYDGIALQQKESFMGVKVRQKDGKWYVFINHHGQRKAKCVGDSKKAAEEVKRKLEAKLTLGDVGLLDAAPQAVLVGDYAEQWLGHYFPVG